MNDNSPKQYEIENLEDIHDLIIINEYEERKANNEVEYITFEEMKEVLDIQIITMLDTISDEVSNDIIDDVLTYIEDIVLLENNGVMNEQLYNKYLRRLKEQQYKEIILLHLKKLGLDYEINKLKHSKNKNRN